MTNYLEKILCVEILERIARMQRFLHLNPDTPRQKGIEVVSIFLKALEGILDNLTPIINRLSEENVLDAFEKRTFIRQLSDIFNAIDELHFRLQFIYGSWVTPETHVFIKNILELIPTNRHPGDLSIILSNRYSFEEFDLPSHFEYVLSTTNVAVDFQSERPTIFLPKIERDNPLNWSILVHECGHIDSTGINSLLQDPEIIPPQEEGSTRRILQNWAEEIYCDLFATRILGPAYLASFATFALVVAGANGGETASKTHPADIVRICIMRRLLEKNNLKVNLTKPQLGYTDIGSLFYHLIEERISLDRRYLYSTPRPAFPFAHLSLTEFSDAICEKVEELIALSQQLVVEDFARIPDLAKQLSERMPIGSYPKLDHITSTKENNLDDKLLPNAQGIIDLQKYSETINAVQEYRTLPWEIINAGWLHKVESIYPHAFSLFFHQNNMSLSNKINTLGEELLSIDKLLLKSIETSEIQRFLTKKEL